MQIDKRPSEEDAPNVCDDSSSHKGKVRRTPKKGPRWGWKKMFILGDYIENQETFEGAQKKNNCKLK